MDTRAMFRQLNLNDNNVGPRLVQFPLTIILIRIKETITTPVG
jgi:hypothetical protein